MSMQCAYLAACCAQAKPVPLPVNALQPPPVIGVVGAGQVGGHILRLLLALGWPPWALGACSRNKRHLSQFEAEGVQCTQEAVKLVQWDKTG